jgi:hypothetical protein
MNKINGEKRKCFLTVECQLKTEETGKLTFVNHYSNNSGRKTMDIKKN